MDLVQLKQNFYGVERRELRDGEDEPHEQEGMETGPLQTGKHSIELEESRE